MALTNKILLDRIIATPVAHVLNVLAAVIGRVMRRSRSTSPADTGIIVVAKLVGFGSAIQATPMLQALRSRFPEARIVFVTLRVNRPIVERLPGIDEVRVLDDSSARGMLLSTISLIVWLNLQNIDHYLDLELYSRFASVLAICSRARNRGGFFRQTARFRLGIYTHLVFFNTRLPVSQTYLQLAHCFGCSGDVWPLQVSPPTAEERTRLKQAVPEYESLPSRPLVVVNPNASDLMLERRWPDEHVALLVERLTAAGIRVCFIGAPSESAHVAGVIGRLSRAARADVIDASGRTSLTTLVPLLADASALVSNDSGPMHLAIALDVPTICLFGPASPDHYGVDKPNVALHYAAVPCSPCVHEIDEPPCRGDNICMQRIRPDHVAQTVVQLLSNDAADRDSSRRLPLLWMNPRTHDPLASIIRK